VYLLLFWSEKMKGTMKITQVSTANITALAVSHFAGSCHWLLPEHVFINSIFPLWNVKFRQQRRLKVSRRGMWQCAVWWVVARASEELMSSDFLWNVASHLPDYMVSCPRWLRSCGLLCTRTATSERSLHLLLEAYEMNMTILFMLCVCTLDCRCANRLSTNPRTVCILVPYQHGAHLPSSWRTEYKRQKNLSSWGLTPRLRTPYAQANS
jgi:hypothetical protein